MMNFEPFIRRPTPTLFVVLAFLLAVPAMSAEPDSFKACIDATADGKSRIVVTGTVWQGGCETKSIVRADPQGINPKILMLRIDDKIRQGICPKNIMSKDLRYEEPAAKGDFTQVHIQDGKAEVIPVEEACQ
jgi:hypothetical protein